MRQQAVVTDPDAEAPGDPPQQHREDKSFPAKHEQRRNCSGVKDEHGEGCDPNDWLLEGWSRLKNPRVRIMSPYCISPEISFGSSEISGRRNAEETQFTIVIMAARSFAKMVNYDQFHRIPMELANNGELIAIWSRELGPALAMASFAKGNSKREKSRMRRTSLRTNYFGSFTHFFPDPNCCRIHIEEPDLIASLTPKSVDTYCSQEACLPGREQVGSDAHGRCVLNVLHVLCTLCDDLIIQS
jgi:hypothetical protein